MFLSLRAKHIDDKAFLSLWVYSILTHKKVYQFGALEVKALFLRGISYFFTLDRHLVVQWTWVNYSALRTSIAIFAISAFSRWIEILHAINFPYTHAAGSGLE